VLIKGPAPEHRCYWPYADRNTKGDLWRCDECGRWWHCIACTRYTVRAFRWKPIRWYHKAFQKRIECAELDERVSNAEKIINEWSVN
jgi:hypothetical protein